MVYFFILFLFLIQSSQATTELEINDLFAQTKRDKIVYQSRGITPAVLVVEQLVEQLKKEADIQKAGQRVAALRLLIGKGTGVGGLRSRKTHGGNYKANDTERTILINAIAYIETAAALIDGHFSFHFCKREQTQPYGATKTIPGTYRDEDSRTLEAMAANGNLTLEEQRHLTIVYALSRATQLKVENDATPYTEFSAYIRRTINSQHLPNFMREVYKKDLMTSAQFMEMLKKQDNPWDLVNFDSPLLKLVEHRRAEKINDKRLAFETQKLRVEIKEYSEHLGESVFMPKEERQSKEKMQVYAVPPNHGCQWYAVYSIYGYEQPWDLIDLTIDNIADEQELAAEFVKMHLINFVIGLPDDFPRLRNQVKDFVLRKASLEQEKLKIMTLFSNMEKEQPNAHEEWLKSEYARWCFDVDFIKEVLSYYRNYSLNLSNARNIDTLGGLSLFLSSESPRAYARGIPSA